MARKKKEVKEIEEKKDNDIKIEEMIKSDKTNLVKMTALLVVLALALLLFFYKDFSFNGLPKPEVTGGERGKLGIDKNINEETLDYYLGRSDIVYRDMRMLKDPGNYESIGGDSYLSGFVKGFEVVPYPLLTKPKGLPESVGEGYTGKSLFDENEDGTYTANYDESLDFLEYYFPKDKVIFLMCGGGGYAGMTKKLLVSLGWDENKIYDVGGYWNYNGKNNVEVKRTVDGETVYDFYKVTYHDIDFESLHERY